ncbi:MAG: hypothetical protein AAF597_09120, partial [Bacteroidota bacterium]
LYLPFLTKFGKAFIFVIPGLFFQLLLAVAIKKPIFPVVLGLFLMILGIPIANLAKIYLIPYSYPILVQDPATNLGMLLLMSALVVVGCSVAMQLLLSNRKIK